jgi:hypothetical protein
MRATLPENSRPSKPSTLKRTSWPTRTRGMSEAGTWASSVRCSRSTMAITGLSGESFSPACTKRLLTTPDSGARMTVSFSAMRARSSWARAASTAACASSTLLRVVSKEFCEM